MAMSITMAVNADVTPYEGEDLDTTWDDTMRDSVGGHAESYICSLFKYDAVTNWGTLNAVYKLLMTEYVARSIAVTGIAYKMTGEAAAMTRIEAEDRINIHLYRLNIIDNILKLADIQDFQGV